MGTRRPTRRLPQRHRPHQNSFDGIPEWCLRSTPVNEPSYTDTPENCLDLATKREHSQPVRVGSCRRLAEDDIQSSEILVSCSLFLFSTIGFYFVERRWL